MKLSRKFVHRYRKIYNRIKYRKINHNNITIISRDCVGAALYSDFNMKYLSPTINLGMSNEDFVLFCNNLEDIIELDVKEYKNKKYKYPVGYINYKSHKLLLHFAHYKTIDNAIECWERRKKRICYDNIYVIMCCGPNVSENDVELFETIKYDRKVLLSSGVDTKKHKDCFNMKCYENGYKDSLIAHYNKYSFKRYLSEYDWINFFNR